MAPIFSNAMCYGAITFTRDKRVVVKTMNVFSPFSRANSVLKM